MCRLVKTTIRLRNAFRTLRQCRQLVDDEDIPDCTFKKVVLRRSSRPRETSEFDEFSSLCVYGVHPRLKLDTGAGCFNVIVYEIAPKLSERHEPVPEIVLNVFRCCCSSCFTKTAEKWKISVGAGYCSWLLQCYSIQKLSNISPDFTNIIPVCLPTDVQRLRVDWKIVSVLSSKKSISFQQKANVTYIRYTPTVFICLENLVLDNKL